MEPAVGTRAPLPLPAAGRPVLLAALARPRGGFASISALSSSSGGDGGGRFSAGGGGGRGGGDDSGAGAAAAVAVLGEADSSDADADAIVLHVGPEVALATVDVEKAIAVVWTTPEAKATEDWRKQLGEKLANHLTTCGFQSHLQDEGEAEQIDS
ncbi:copper-transporting ATPase PAA1, chloroplastic-like isoform X2 [Panicum hallii]|uniref:copper-transporting ATPase PAA1, chloroplastic-like isoform X2 n=1 Tax=Panicum hallii TaxID=206008 RepID=UPI000DF4EC7F|nr:copper-transporting ATPase PAA1, chloroplastic-like isoform X2 [Panicum hallii]